MGPSVAADRVMLLRARTQRASRATRPALEAQARRHECNRGSGGGGTSTGPAMASASTRTVSTGGAAAVERLCLVADVRSALVLITVVDV